MILPFYFTINMTKVNDLDSLDSIKDEYSLTKESQIKLNRDRLESNAIDPIYDIPITDVCNYLYKK
jgi:hypothetical protein